MRESVNEKDKFVVGSQKWSIKPKIGVRKKVMKPLIDPNNNPSILYDLLMVDALPPRAKNRPYWILLDSKFNWEAKWEI